MINESAAIVKRNYPVGGIIPLSIHRRFYFFLNPAGCIANIQRGISAV
jgi:hypothetical protein